MLSCVAVVSEGTYLLVFSFHYSMDLIKPGSKEFLLIFLGK